MAKVRVYELAKEFGVESKAVMDQLKEMGEFVRSASSTIEAPVVRRLKEAFSTKAAEQPAQRSRPAASSAGSPDGSTVPRDGAAPAAARPRPDVGAGTAPQTRDDRAAAAAAAAAAPAPRTAPDGTANGSAERAVAPDGAAASGTSAAPDVAARRLPPVPPSPASRPGPGPEDPGDSGRSRCPEGARTAADPGHPRRLPQSGDGSRGPGQSRGPGPALGSATRRAGRLFRAAPGCPRGPS